MTARDERTRRFTRDILLWRDQSGRDFPWRQDLDPFRLLVTEVLLRRSRSKTVSQVIGELFQRWPTAGDLSGAHPDDVREVIRPLGLLRRAEQLVEMAQQVHDLGCVPSNPETLVKLPGVGPYAARATLGLPVVDGTSARVYRRYFGALDVDAHNEVDDQLWNLVIRVTPPEVATELNWAVLDLAASHCSPRKPVCANCPLSEHCTFRQRSLASTERLGPAESF